MGPPSAKYKTSVEGLRLHGFYDFGESYQTALDDGAVAYDRLTMLYSIYMRGTWYTLSKDESDTEKDLISYLIDMNTPARADYNETLKDICLTYSLTHIGGKKELHILGFGTYPQVEEKRTTAADYEKNIDYGLF